MSNYDRTPADAKWRSPGDSPSKYVLENYPREIFDISTLVDVAVVTAVTAVTKVELRHREEHLRKNREDHFLG